MPDVEFGNLLGVLVVGVVAPLLLGLAPRVRVPAVVLEIVLGVVLGPSALGWLDPDLAVQVVGLLGLAMLLFLAGLEIDVTALRGSLLKAALAGYVVSIAVGWLAGLALDSAGWVDDPVLLAVTVSATSLGLVVAVLKDARAVDGRLGQTVIC
jgi:Kef-type K+ transport system membrane component KefB